MWEREKGGDRDVCSVSLYAYLAAAELLDLFLKDQWILFIMLQPKMKEKIVTKNEEKKMKRYFLILRFESFSNVVIGNDRNGILL